MTEDITWKQKIVAQENEQTQDLSLTIGSTSLHVAKSKMIDGPPTSQALGNKLSKVKTDLREVGIIIERPENKANHSKNVILIKQDVSDGKLSNDVLVGKGRNSCSN